MVLAKDMMMADIIVLRDELLDVLQVIRGDVPYTFYRGGILTYPGADANQQAIYQACRELECLGLIRRTRQWNMVDGACIHFEARD
jgi:hypothetical protein